MSARVLKDYDDSRWTCLRIGCWEHESGLARLKRVMAGTIYEQWELEIKVLGEGWMNTGASSLCLADGLGDMAITKIIGMEMKNFYNAQFPADGAVTQAWCAA